jgi:hypothetical protein
LLIALGVAPEQAIERPFIFSRMVEVDYGHRRHNLESVCSQREMDWARHKRLPHSHLRSIHQGRQAFVETKRLSSRAA